MPTPNPFFALQQRVQALLQAASYFSGLHPDQILTEAIGDLTFRIEHKIIALGFGLVITTAEGKAMEGSGEFEELISLEDLNVSIVSNPTTDPTHNALDALWAAIQAIHGKSVTSTPPPVGRPFDFFRVTAHQRRHDAPEHLHVHELHLSIGTRLL